MKLQRREQILAGVALGLVVLVGLGLFFSTGGARTTQELNDDQAKLTTEIENKQKVLQAGEGEQRRLEQWRQRALPRDAVLARSLYHSWLTSLAARANFRELRVSDNDVGGHRDQCTRISFALDCRTNLGDLVQFLYEFYSAGFLHQIRRMDLKPDGNSRDLTVMLTIEALSLTTAESKDSLPTQVGHPQEGNAQQPTKLADYRNAIVSRNVFANFVRPMPPMEVRIEAATVTGFTEVDGAWLVWLEDRAGQAVEDGVGRELFGGQGERHRAEHRIQGAHRRAWPPSARAPPGR